MLCCTIVAMHLRPGFILVRPIDRRLSLWLGSLAALAAFNVGLWIWIARSVSLRTPYAETQLLLSKASTSPSPRDGATASVAGTRRSPGMSGARKHPG